MKSGEFFTQKLSWYVDPVENLNLAIAEKRLPLNLHTPLGWDPLKYVKGIEVPSHFNSGKYSGAEFDTYAMSECEIIPSTQTVHFLEVPERQDTRYLFVRVALRDLWSKPLGGVNLGEDAKEGLYEAIFHHTARG